MQTTPPNPNPEQASVQPVLVTEQQLQGELGSLVDTAGQAKKGRRWLIILIIVVALAALVWAAIANDWFGSSSSSNSELDGAATTLDSTPPATTNTTTNSNTATAETDTTADLTTAAGRDNARRDRLNLFVEAARKATEAYINLPITTAPIKLNDSTNSTVQSIRQILKDQNVSDATIDEYLADPQPDQYYFGYNYDGQLLTLTAVLEVAGTDCTLTTTPSGQICVLKKVVEL